MLLLWILFVVIFACLCLSIMLSCLVATCWERADLLYWMFSCVFVFFPILYPRLGLVLDCIGSWCLPCFNRGHYEERFCGIILNLDQRFRMRCHFKMFTLSFGCHLVQWNGTFWQFGRGHYEEHLREIILNLVQRLRRCGLKFGMRCHFKIFTLSSGCHLV